MIEQRVLAYIKEYDMIPAGSRVLLAVSGGKDSICLLHLLAALRDKGALDFELAALHVETDAKCDPGVFERLIEPRCQALAVPLAKVYFPILAQAGERLTCFYCAMRRRAAFFKYAEDHHFDRLALGHHQDDIAETVLMNLAFHGNISTMSPTQALFGGRLTMIRPLCQVREQEVRDHMAPLGLPFRPSSCAYSSENIRGPVKRWLVKLDQRIPGVTANVFNALKNLR